MRRRRARQLSETQQFVAHVAAFHPEKVPANFRREFRYELMQIRLAVAHDEPVRTEYGPAASAVRDHRLSDRRPSPVARLANVASAAGSGT